MTIDEAIKILTALHKLHQNRLVLLEEEAVKQGIEALKRLEHLRKDFDLLRSELLPGETKD